MSIRTMTFQTSIFFWLVFLFTPSFTWAQDKQVKVTAIRTVKGNLILHVFKDSEAYENQKPYKKIVVDKKGLSQGVMLVSLDLEPGTYGITLVDDENGDGELNKNFIGIPKEGFGFSNFFMEKMTKPVFSDFKVELKSNTKIDIKVKYM